MLQGFSFGRRLVNLLPVAQRINPFTFCLLSFFSLSMYLLSWWRVPVVPVVSCIQYPRWNGIGWSTLQSMYNIYTPATDTPNERKNYKNERQGKREKHERRKNARSKANNIILNVSYTCIYVPEWFVSPGAYYATYYIYTW